MEAMQEQEILQAFLKLMEENSRKEQAQDLTLLLSYLRDMEHQLDAVVNELHTVKQELAEQKAGLNPAGRREVSARVEQLEGSAHHLFEKIEELRSRIVTCAANALENVKQAGTVALDRAVSAMGLGKALAAIQRSASQSMADTKRHIEGIETISHELRSVGGHLKNIGRTMTGKETQRVDGGKEGAIQAGILAPLRAAYRIHAKMNNTALAAIGAVERLEQAAAKAQEKRVEKKPSIRKNLEEKKAEAAARPAPDKEKRPQEAAL